MKIHKFLLQSKQRTRKKEEADLFFVPSYVKCARMMGGLNDKEINNTYVQVIHSEFCLNLIPSIGFAIALF